MSIPNKKDALGKGIRSLLQNIDVDLSTTANSLKKEIPEKLSPVNTRIPLSLIEPNPEQPRRDFDESSLSELAASLKMHDIIQPITVAKIANGKYRIIAGERRYRAAKIAGLTDVPVYIREPKDSKVLELALLENLQREDLNAIEIALSYKQLMDELDYTQEQLAERMGKERSTVTNYIRLLKLPPDIQAAVRNGIISMGHARALINVDVVDKQLYIFNEIKNKELSVRQTEDLVRKLYTPINDSVNNSVKATLPPSLKKIEDNLASYFSTKVKMTQNKKGTGSITLDYYSIDELTSILEKMQVPVD
ncbi:ParB/RepB/Spo0J family partition protein [Ginsengibacter hankyongi]|uniref:ParB/RepB/Spo0J family partition protein n=1 Tax=Ginsengibacter hankyongi TaxID=2607284 RepID=A0A5J5IL93_9BACT|nr:ParB/RepB/Spo0J family partition protein [Ginsengibacter hankyongi]KAA9041133.1 ParB/RepB/Spo0J family partition protein [Ginsengibacter hankyongi]